MLQSAAAFLRIASLTVEVLYVAKTQEVGVLIWCRCISWFIVLSSQTDDSNYHKLFLGFMLHALSMYFSKKC